VRHFIRRVLKRQDMTAKSQFTLIEGGSCFAGTLLEVALSADRTYMLDDPDVSASVATSPMNASAYPMGNGLTRLASRFLGDPAAVTALLERSGEHLDTSEADEMGLVTDAPDDLDWDDTIRMSLEERASLSPDALTAMEANLRFGGPETLETKIFGRLTAWQNWIFQRPNAVGSEGALTLYGHPKRPVFNWKRT
jgi:benzoyl-CoA-dihydrodiol lyase